MVQTLFDVDQPIANHTTVIYNLQPSQQLVGIRSVLASRKRKSNSLSSTPVPIPVDTVDDVGKKQKYEYDEAYIGLPSPPVESSPLDDFPAMSKRKSTQSPPMTPNTAFNTSSSSSVTTETDTHISLIEETEDVLSTDSIKSKLAALREEKHNMFQLLKRLVEQEEQQQQQQQQQQQHRMRRPSRWSTPSAYQRPSPLSQHHANHDSSTVTSRYSAV